MATIHEITEDWQREGLSPTWVKLQQAQAEFDALTAELESYKRDAIRFRFANESEQDFGICYWHEDEDGGDWWCYGPKGDAIALLDRAIADAAMKGE